MNLRFYNETDIAAEGFDYEPITEEDIAKDGLAAAAEEAADNQEEAEEKKEDLVQEITSDEPAAEEKPKKKCDRYFIAMVGCLLIIASSFLSIIGLSLKQQTKMMLYSQAVDATFKETKTMVQDMYYTIEDNEALIDDLMTKNAKLQEENETLRQMSQDTLAAMAEMQISNVEMETRAETAEARAVKAEQQLTDIYNALAEAMHLVGEAIPKE